MTSIAQYLYRGTLVGAGGGLFYGLFILFIGNDLVSLAEQYETTGHTSGLGVFPSIIAGVIWGLFLGIIVFGLGYYLLEPELPGSTTTHAYLLGLAGFLSFSGVPWLVLPPTPPGVIHDLSPSTRLMLYGLLMIVGSATVIGVIVGYHRMRVTRNPRYFVWMGIPLGVLIVIIWFSPTNPQTSSVPPELSTVFLWITVFGQVVLWGCLASLQAVLVR